MDVIDPTEPHQPPFERRQEAMRVFPFQSLGSRNCGGDTVDGSEIQLKRPVIYEIQWNMGYTDKYQLKKNGFLPVQRMLIQIFHEEDSTKWYRLGMLRNLSCDVTESFVAPGHHFLECIGHIYTNYIKWCDLHLLHDILFGGDQPGHVRKEIFQPLEFCRCFCC